MQSTDWILCNGCFGKPQPGVGFFISNCGHLADDGCVQKTPGHCPFCKKECKFMELNNSLTPEIQTLFDDTAKALKKEAGNLRKIVQVIEFQRTQQGLASRQGLQIQQEFSQAKNALQTSAGEIERLRSENAKQKADIAALTAKLNAVGVNRGVGGGGNSRGGGGFNFPFGAPQTPATPTSNAAGFLNNGLSQNTPASGFFQFRGNSNSKTPMAPTPTSGNPYRDAWQKSPIFAANRNAAGPGGKIPVNRTRVAGATPNGGSNRSSNIPVWQGANRASSNIGVGSSNNGFGGTGQTNLGYPCHQQKRF